MTGTRTPVSREVEKEQASGSSFERRHPLLALALLACLGDSLATRTSGQTITEFSLSDVLAGGAQIRTGPDGNLWFTEDCAGRIGRITTAGAVTEFPVPRSTGIGDWAHGIVTGPDGNLWFTSDAMSYVGRITTSGVVTTFSFPAGGRQKGITVGADGNLWYTTSLGIATMTTAGAFLAQYTVPGTPLSGTRSIVAGPDGNLWFTAVNNNTVGRMTTAGAFTEFPVPTPGANPFEIAVGPDGALWFTERGSTQIGRITTSGAITEFPVAGGGVLNGIGSGLDGNLWFGSTPGRVGRITPSGVIDLFSTPTADTNPFGFTTGPDGAVWFTERSSGCATLPNYAGIGRVALGAAEPTPTATATPPTITPTVTPPIGPGPANQIPTLSAGFLVVLGVLVAGAAILLIRRA